MRKFYEWAKRNNTFVCQICKKVYPQEAPRQKYCKSEECRKVLKERHYARLKFRRHRLSKMGIPIGSKHNH